MNPWDSEDRGGIAAFPAAAVRPLLRPALKAPALALLVLLTASNIVILLNLPPEGTVPGFAFLAAAFLRIGGALVLSLAILRLLAPGERDPWRPDEAFWLYVLAFIISFSITVAVAALVGETDALRGIVRRNLVTAVVLSFIAPWVVGAAVATPAGWNPARFLHHFADWLPALILWNLLVLTPMAILHAVIDVHLVTGAGGLFWPLALFDGALSTVLAVLGLAFNAEAYRRVARG